MFRLTVVADQDGELDYIGIHIGMVIWSDSGFMKHFFALEG
jgi:hypothetical protein